MDFFSDRRWWAKPKINSVAELLKRDLPEVYYKDPFIQGLHNSISGGSWDEREFKSQYWPSLVSSLSHENPFVRSLSLSLVLDEEQTEVKKEIWNHFQDTFPLCRLMVVDGFKAENRSRLFHEIFLIATKDPVSWVRRAARQRIKKDFADLLNFQFENFPIEEKYHLLDLLDLGTAADRDTVKKSLKEKNELSLKIQWELKQQSQGSQIILNPDNPPLKAPWKESHLISVQDHMDLEGMEDSRTAQDALDWLKSPSERGGLLTFCNVVFQLKDHSGIKESLLKSLVDVILEQPCTLQFELLEILIHDGEWDGACQNLLLPILQSRSISEEDRWLTILLQKDYFNLNKEWRKELCNQKEGDLPRLLLLWLKDMEPGNPLFNHALELVAHCDKELKMDMLEIICDRRNNDRDFKGFSREIFLSIVDWDKKGIKYFIKDILKKPHWGFTPYWLMTLHQDFIDEWEKLLEEQFCYWNCQWKVDFLGSLMELDRERYFQWLLKYQEDPSFHVRNYIQAFLGGELTQEEQKILNEW